MAHYRKVDSRIWTDEKFRALTERGKLSFLFVLTHPRTTMIGTVHGTLLGLASELHASSARDPHTAVLEGFGEALLEGYLNAFREAIDKGSVRYDERAALLWLPNFVKYNPPESPNVVKAWPHAYDLVPECPLKHEVYQRLQGYVQGMGEGFRKAFTKGFSEGLPKSMPNQEQEQEQDKNLNNTASQYCFPAANSAVEVDAGLELKILQLDGKFFPITQSQIAQWKALYPMVDVVQEVRAMIGWSVANPKKRKTKAGMLKFANSWLAGEQKKAAEHRAQEDATMRRRQVGMHNPNAPVPLANCWHCNKKYDSEKTWGPPTGDKAKDRRIIFCSQECFDKSEKQFNERKAAAGKRG